MEKLVALLIDDDDFEDGDIDDEETDVNETLKELTDVLGRSEDNCQFFAAIRVCRSVTVADILIL